MVFVLVGPAITNLVVKNYLASLLNQASGRAFFGWHWKEPHSVGQYTTLQPNPDYQLKDLKFKMVKRPITYNKIFGASIGT